MEKVIQDYLEGNFCYETGFLEFSCPKLEITIKMDDVWEGSFEIYAAGDDEVRGFVISQSSRMECRTPYFDRKQTCIECRFDSKGLEEGAVVQGEFCIVSNYGEYTIPYSVTVNHAVIECNTLQIKNLFQFTNLAKINWEAAVNLFYDIRFQKIFQGNDAQYYTAYKGLKNKIGSESNVEEFLLEINKKQCVEYIPKQQEIIIKNPQSVIGQVLEIEKNGWGYTHAEIIVDGDFLATEKTVLCNEDFISDMCRLDYYISLKRLHGGNNYGSITIKSTYHTITIPVTVIKSQGQTGKVWLEKKQSTNRIMQSYLRFRQGRYQESDWLEQTRELVEAYLKTTPDDVVYRLFHTQILLTTERWNEAGWVLSHVTGMIEKGVVEPGVYCYYLYLNTLSRKDKKYTLEAAEIVRTLHARHPDDWRISWICLCMDETYQRSETARWQMLEEMFFRNCQSPLLYMEAVDMLKANPSLLMRLNEFEIQVLHFAVKNNLLTEEIIRQLHYPADRIKQYRHRIFQILCACYEVKADDETLYAICTHLIKGGKIGEPYFKWYHLAVQRELRITRLYEYFMMSVDRNYIGELPKMVLMYFAYQSNLDYEKNAFLYAYIIKHREQQPELYQSYRIAIEKFIEQQIRKGNMNEDLAYLYKHAITSAMVKDTAVDFISLLFTKLVKVERQEIKRVVIVYRKKKQEISYPVNAGRAYIPIYGDDFKLLLEDQEKNRYIKGVPFVVEKLMYSDALIKETAKFVFDNLDLNLYLCQGNKHYISIHNGIEERAAKVAAVEDVELFYRREICMHLMQYYFEQDEIEKMDRLLIGMEPEQFTPKERADIIRYMITREFYEKAFAWMIQFGLEGVDAKSIVRLCGRMLEGDCGQEQEELLSVIYYAFQKGKYNEVILQYLIQHFEGTTTQMRDMWKAGEAFEVDTYPLSERLLLQMLFSRGYVAEDIDIYTSYIKKGAQNNLSMAFLAHLSYEYFVQDRVIGADIWDTVMRLKENGEELPFVTKMAYVKYMAEEETRRKDLRYQQAVKEFLLEMCAQNLYFAFYQDLFEYEEMVRFIDKTMLEYRTKPDKRVILYYLVEQEDESKYYREEMQHMFGGIFVKSFVLFFGDVLQYYIVEEEAGEEVIMTSGVLGTSEVGRTQPESRYGIINDITAGNILQDYDTVEHLLEEYTRTDYMVKQFFHIV